MRELFRNFQVLEVRFVKDHDTGLNKDYAFIEFQSQEIAHKAFDSVSKDGLNRFGNAQIKYRGEPLQVGLSK